MENAPAPTAECQNCGRHFSQQALSRHEPICIKSGQKKRRVFDSSKQRAEGTELKQFQKKNPLGKAPPAGRGNNAPVGIRQPAARGGNWRQKHEELIQALRSAKAASHAIATGQPLPPPPPPSLNPDYVGCPYCNRRFNEKAAQRHISFCKEQHERLPTKKTIDTTTANRANARTTYKAPAPRGGKAAAAPSSMYDDGSYGSANSRGGFSSGLGTKSAFDNEPGHGRVLRTGRTPEAYSEARELSAQQRASMPVKKTPATRQPIKPEQNDYTDDMSAGRNGSYGMSGYGGKGSAAGGRGGGFGASGGTGGYGAGGAGGYGAGGAGGYGAGGAGSYGAAGAGSYGAGGVGGYGAGGAGGYGGSAGSPAAGNSFGYRGTASRGGAASGSLGGRAGLSSTGGGGSVAGRGIPAQASASASKFCGNCGANFPTVQAKFCGDCGCKRS